LIRQKRAGFVLAFFFTISLFLVSAVSGEERKPSSPSAKDKCPVCGMFVAKYPDWLSRVVFKDGTVFFFDGAKDMFKFYFNLKRYSPKRTIDDISALYVTDYYSLNPVDGFTAVYVIGSDVYGPMGRELIPFGKHQEAIEFRRDHKGKEILQFQHVNPAVMKGLD
jgi:nitrous oxide reductase accessory protein NosL